MECAALTDEAPCIAKKTFDGATCVWCTESTTKCNYRPPWGERNVYEYSVDAIKVTKYQSESCPLVEVSASNRLNSPVYFSLPLRQLRSLWRAFL
jgi:hypothetical protein